MSMTTGEFLERYDNGEHFDEDEIENICYENFRDYENCNEEDEIQHDEGRWTAMMETILKIQNRYFSIGWERGLTEMQDNIFMDRPVEVKPVTKTITKTITIWEVV